MNGPSVPSEPPELSALPELPDLEGFLSRGFSKVPEEVVKRVGEALDLCCALFVIDIDGTSLRPVSSWTEASKSAPESGPMEVSLMDDEHTPNRLVFERRSFHGSRKDWEGQKPLDQDHLCAVPLRAADEVSGMLVVGDSAPLEQESAKALWSLGFQAGAALGLADRYSDRLANAYRRRRLSLAAEMQQSLLPPGEMHDPRVGVAGGIEPAYEIGDDWYDYALRNGSLYAAVGDPTGKGIRAEMLAAVCFAATRNARRQGEGLAGIMTAAHRAVREASDSGMFCTLVLVEIDLSTLEAELLVAGHPAPLHIRADGSYEDGVAATLLPISGRYPPVGALEQEEDYQTEHYQLSADSKLLLYSDGVTERGDSVGEMMGTKGLLRYARENRKLRALPFMRGLLGRVDDHAQKPMKDDATALILDFGVGQASVK